MLHKLREYEDSLEILQKILQLSPANSLVKQYILGNEEVLLTLKEDIQKEEDRIRNIQNDQIFYKYNGILFPPKHLIQFKSADLLNLKKDIKSFKDAENYKVFLEKIKREWSVHLGDLEGIYKLSNRTTKKLINLGIMSDIILHDESDVILSYTKNAEREARAFEIKEILDDQIDTLNFIYSIVKTRKLELSNDLLFQIHSMLLNTASFSALANGEIILIRRNKFKNVPNIVLRSDRLYHMWALPSIVERELKILYETFEKLLQLNLSAEVLAGWFHSNFIKIHPFQDGNGRVARAICSLIFIYHGMLPLLVPMYEKDRYIEYVKEGIFGDDKNLISYFVEKQLVLWEKFRKESK